MSDELEKKHKILEEKYKDLRRNHKKLAGVALELARALESFIKDDRKPDISAILLSCSNIYPGLMKDRESSIKEVSDGVESEAILEAREYEKKEPDAEEEKEEYQEGFWSRPKIPRTPQI